MPCAAVWPCLLCGMCHGPCSLKLLPVCMCRVLYCRQSPRWLLGLLEKHLSYRCIMMNVVSDVAAAQTTSTSGCTGEKGAQSLKVRSCMRTLSPPNDSAMCWLACQRGCLWLTGYPHLIPIFYGDHSRTPGSLERRAP